MVDYSILFGGKAGEGAKQAAETFANIVASLGYFIYIYDDYPSVIRGGHNFSVVRFSDKKVLAHNSKYDIVVAFDANTVDVHKKELTKDGVILYDNNFSVGNVKAKTLGLPLTKVVNDVQGKPIMRNIAAIGALAKMFGLDWNALEKLLRETLKKETDRNVSLAKSIYALKTIDVTHKVPVRKGKVLPIMRGNEATGLGAVDAGLKFYYAYPMTPSSGILHYLAENAQKFNITVVHPENEISVMIMALGSAYAGQKTMVASATGGFALMVEGVSMAAQAEIPMCIGVVQRPGPATGVPTYTTQGDLNFVLNAGHGEFVKFLVAPGDAEECYYYTGLAMNIAWKYQIPSFVLTDKQVGEGAFSFDKTGLKLTSEMPLMWNGQGNYNRYEVTKSGISPLAFPGSSANAIVKVTSYEHDKFGIATEDVKEIKEMIDKRLRKGRLLQKEIEKLRPVKVYGNKSSKTVLIMWGSTKGPVIEVAEKLNLKVVQPIILSPFPSFAKYLKGAKKVVCVEANATSQLAQLLKTNGIKVDKTINKYDGRPFFTDELYTLLKKEVM